VSSMEAVSVGNVEPVHGGGEVCIWRSEEKVVVIVHQAKGENVEVKASGGKSDKIKKCLLVTGIKENNLMVIAA
jgi:hypothetical protein